MKDDLASRIKLGDEKAFELFFHKYFINVCCYINKFFNNPQEAKEIAQDVFIKIWESKNDIDLNKTLEGYLFRTAHNLCLNKLRRLKVESKYAEIYKLVYIKHYELSAEESFLAKELNGRVVNAINKLTPRCRQIFELSRFEGKRNKEIAKLLHISIKTVETQMTKALQTIRVKLAGSI